MLKRLHRCTTAVRPPSFGKPEPPRTSTTPLSSVRTTVALGVDVFHCGDAVSLRGAPVSRRNGDVILDLGHPRRGPGGTLGFLSLRP
jgi:hypothetical protein